MRCADFVNALYKSPLLYYLLLTSVRDQYVLRVIVALVMFEKYDRFS